MMKWPAGGLAKHADVPLRTPRRYNRISLLTPTRTSGSELRLHGVWTVTRLQRILLLHEIGMSLADIAELLDGEIEDQGDEAPKE